MPSSFIAWHVGDLVLAATILVLLRRNLAGRYRAWWCFLVLQLVRGVVLAFIYDQSLLYARVFMITDLIADVLLALSMFEFFRLLAEHYPGIKLAGTWFLNIGLGISFLICLATVGPDWKGIDWSAPQLYLVLLVKRVVVGVLGVFGLLIFGAFLLYRVRVRPNVIWHGLLLTGYLWLQSVLSVTDAWSGLNVATLRHTNSVREAATIFLYLGWSVLLTRRGEEVEIADRLTEDERYQLDRLNEELLVLARRAMRGAG